MIYLFLLFSGLFLLDYGPIRKIGDARTKVAFWIIFAFALAYGVMAVLTIEVPSLLKYIGDFYKALGLFYPQS